MGAVTFSVDINLVEFLVQHLDFECFIETGTFRGDTLELVKPYFPQCFSIELSEEYYQIATARFQQDSSVTILKGDSGTILEDIVRQMEGASILFWLDAHWCEADDTAGRISQSPLLQEIQAIRQLHERSVLLIDDARLYLCPPGTPHEYSQWPDFKRVLRALASLSDVHELIVFNDILIYYPQSIHNEMRGFAHGYGVNWLDAMVKSLEHDHLLQEIQTKEQEIQTKEQEIQTKEQEIQKLTDIWRNKEEIIQAQQQELVAKEAVIQSLIIFQRSPLRYWCMHCPKLLLKRVLSTHIQDKIHRLRQRLQPKLGQLQQYSPVPLEIPEQHSALTTVSQQPLPSVSIVTPSFNQAQFLECTLQSMLGQNYSNLEYIVQDGGSTDGTPEILEKYRPRLTHAESCQDGGQANALNRGFERSTGEIMAWLNSDDILLPGTLAYVAQFFQDHPEVDVVYGHRIVINEADQEIGRWILPPHDARMLRWADYVPQETLFWRRRIWEKAGGRLDESFHFALDWELLLRFCDAGAIFRRLPRFLAAFRVHAGQKTSQHLNGLGFREMARLREHLHGRPVSHAEAQRQIRGYMRKHVLYDRAYRAGLLRY